MTILLGSTGVTTVVNSFEDLWLRFSETVPSIVGAVVIFAIGLFVAVVIDAFITRVFRALPFDSALRKLGFGGFFDRAGVKLDAGKFIGTIARWFIILAFLIASTELLDLPGVSNFLADILLFIPNIVVAALILVFSVLVAYLVDKSVHQGLKGFGYKNMDFVAGIAKWSVLIFGFFAALLQLRVAPSLIEVLFTGFVAMVALAGGLAFGLGGKDLAHDTLKNLKKDFKRKK